jgi:hypothetical protein
MDKKLLFTIFVLFALAGCSSPAPQQDLYSNSVSSRATADALLQQAQVQELFLTATAEAPIIRITETAAAMAMQQQLWTITAQSVEGTQIAAMTQTSMAWTPTPNATSTAAFALLNAQGTQMANNAIRDNLELQRQQDINDFKGKLPVYSFVVLVLVLAICMMLIVRRWSFQTAKVDDRGNVLPVLNIVDGIYTDIDRSPNYQGQLKGGLIKRWIETKLNLPPLLPAVTATRQDATTERDQMIDLATRGLPGEQKSEGRKQLAGQAMMNQLSNSNLESRFQILDGQTNHLEHIDGVIVQELDSSWKEAKTE